VVATNLSSCSQTGPAVLRTHLHFPLLRHLPPPKPRELHPFTQKGTAFISLVSRVHLVSALTVFFILSRLFFMLHDLSCHHSHQSFLGVYTLLDEHAHDSTKSRSYNHVSSAGIRAVHDLSACTWRVFDSDDCVAHWADSPPSASPESLHRKQFTIAPIPRNYVRHMLISR